MQVQADMNAYSFTDVTAHWYPHLGPSRNPAPALQCSMAIVASATSSTGVVAAGSLLQERGLLSPYWR